MFRPLTISDIDEAVMAQATAFQYDPLWCYIFLKETQRSKFIRQFFRVFIGAAISVNLAYGVGEPLKGLAIWSKSENPEREFFVQLIRNGGMKLLINP